MHTKCDIYVVVNMNVQCMPFVNYRDTLLNMLALQNKI